MPRLTRRSVASKRETTPEAEESSRSTSRGRRGAKKEEPAQEVVAIGEPQGAPAKRGGRQAAKAKEVESKDETPKKGQKAAGGVRSASRGKRGKKQDESEEEEEPQEDESKEEEAEEEKPQRGGARSRGRGKTVAKGGRSGAKGGKGKSAEKEDSEEDQAKEDEQEEEKTRANVVKTPGSRSRGKAAPVTPSPKGGRKGRDKAEPESEKAESEKKEDDAPDAEIKESADPSSENDVDTETKGRQRRTPNKVSDAPSATPPSGGRRGRGQKAAVTAPPARSSRRGGASTSIASEMDEPEEKEEPMETSAVEEKTIDEEPAKKTEEEPTKKTEEEPAKKTEEEPTKIEEEPTEKSEEEPTKKTGEETAKPSTPSKNAPEESISPSKKRKLEEEEEEEERTVKRPKVIENENSASKDELSDFVIVNKEDVPPSDSKEVSDALVPDEPEVEDSKPDELSIGPPGETNISFVVPLTEAELAKQYTKKLDVDETSSTYVEVGSEAASDITGLSSRGFDVSDALSMDSSASAEQPDQSMELSSACPQNAEDICLNSSDNASTTAQENTQNNATIDVSNDTQSISRKSARVDPLEMYTPSSTGILNRKFTLNPKFPVEMMDPAFCFSVVSYNILADCHLRRGDYSYTKLQYLDQGYRSIILLKELDYLDGDILCLQEVNPVYFKNVLVPAMASRGYEGNFIKRTKDYWDEGEATFVRTSKFTVISSEGFSLKDLAYKELETCPLNEEVSHAAKKYLDRADVILLTQVKCKKTGKLVTICNIHVVYSNDAQDVQCIQVASAIKKLVATAGNDLYPHIICGDFNSIQGSPAQQLAKDGYLSDNDIKRLQAINSLTLKDGTTCALINHMWGAFQHTSSNLKSAYEIALGREPTTTTYTSNTYGTLDYIFHSSFSLDTVGVLETIDEYVLRSTGGLPTSSIPSDHLSLKAVFRLKE
ncbi:unnamed protein product [Lymnaea stagnalis]|uniref:Endonuclease/exonuclease/phosphatase domain-containing protein n=1 Tax=Lymnaea stagnalis TaxID=6523 RepID=A0AAV2HR95_LYMST